MSKWKYSFRRWTLTANPCVTIKKTKEDAYRVEWTTPTEHESSTVFDLETAKAWGEEWTDRRQVSPFA